MKEFTSKEKELIVRALTYYTDKMPMEDFREHPNIFKRLDIFIEIFSDLKVSFDF